MMTPEIVQNLAIEHRPCSVLGGWQDDFDAVLAFWRLGFDNVIQSLEAEIVAKTAAERELLKRCISTVRQLCEPDPRLRGHPVEQAAGNQSGLQRYISQFDLLARRAAIHNL